MMHRRRRRILPPGSFSLLLFAVDDGMADEFDDDVLDEE